MPGIANRVLVNQVSKSARKSIRSKRSRGSSFSAVGLVRRICDLPRRREAQLGASSYVDVCVHPRLCPRYVDVVRLDAWRLCRACLRLRGRDRTNHTAHTERQHRECKRQCNIAYRTLHGSSQRSYTWSNRENTLSIPLEYGLAQSA